MTSSYRFSGPFVVRLMGICLVLTGLLLVLLAVVVAVASLPGLVLLLGVIVAAVATALLVLTARRRAVVQLR